MCGGPQKPLRSPSAMSGSKTWEVDAEGAALLLLELAASDDVAAFRRAVEEEGLPLDVAGPWYGRSFSGGGRMRMGVEQRTPLMIAALYGGADVLGYILSAAPGQALCRSPSDGATPLHLAASGGCPSSPELVRLLLSSYSADPDALDLSGRRPGDLIPRPLPFPASPAPNSNLHHLLLKSPSPSTSPSPSLSPSPSSPWSGSGSGSAKPSSSPPTPKKEYPPDLTLPDIKNGIYSTDEFRMYAFKVKPCSRAYSHDWTECPFVHPGENARRRDPRKFLYSCVPCPEFRKGSCRHGDACEYAHGVFESWLHPAQYRTRLCKDETGCARRVCFFAHKPDELRAVNPSLASVAAGLVLPSPRSSSSNDATAAATATAAALILMQQQQQQQQQQQTPPTSCWMDQQPMTPPAALQLPVSRLKASLSARDLGVELNLLGLEGYQQKLLDELSSAAAAAANSNSNSCGSPRTSWPPADLLDPLVLSQMQHQHQHQQQQQQQHQQLLQHHHHHQHQQQPQQQLLSGFGSNLPSPSQPAPVSASFAAEHSMAKAIMNSRASAFAKRSYSFCDRSATAASAARASPTLPPSAATPPSLLSDWGSPGGKLDWGIQGEELSKLRKSASFGFRTNQTAVSAPPVSTRLSSGSISPPDEPDLSWVQSLVKDGPAGPASLLGGQLDAARDYFHGSDLSAPWAEQEQMVA